MKIQFTSERPNVSIDGMKFILHWKEVQLAELLWKRRPHWANAKTLLGALECSPRSLRLYAMNLRTVFNQYGLTVEGKKQRDLDGDNVFYRMTSTGPTLNAHNQIVFKRRHT